MGSVNVTHISRLQRFYASIARHNKYLKIFCQYKVYRKLHIKQA